MKIAKIYSHLNGYEWIQYHNPQAWQDIVDVIASVDIESCRTKESKERGMVGKMIYSPSHINKCFAAGLKPKGWHSSIIKYFIPKAVTNADPLADNLQAVMRKIVTLSPDEQLDEIANAGFSVLKCGNQTDFVKDRIAIEVQFAKYTFVAYDLFVKHMAFYIGDEIDVGIELLPMKELTMDPNGGRDMSSGVPEFEGELYNLLRQGRNTPAVPLILVGITR